MIHYLHWEQVIPAPTEDVWAYFCDPKNLNAITPPDMNFEIVRGGDEAMYEGQIFDFRTRKIEDLFGGNK